MWWGFGGLGVWSRTSQSASQPVSQSVSQSASQSVSQSASQSASRSVSQPVSHHIEWCEAASQPDSQPVIWSAGHPTYRMLAAGADPTESFFRRDFSHIKEETVLSKGIV